jgi:hypothetical protein
MGAWRTGSVLVLPFSVGVEGGTKAHGVSRQRRRGSSETAAFSFRARAGYLPHGHFHLGHIRCSSDKLGGRKSYAEAMPDTVAKAKQLHAEGLSYRKISAALAAQGHTTGSGKPHVASAVPAAFGGCHRL